VPHRVTVVLLLLAMLLLQLVLVLLIKVRVLPVFQIYISLMSSCHDHCCFICMLHSLANAAQEQEMAKQLTDVTAILKGITAAQRLWRRHKVHYNYNTLLYT
jgi:hypothetical protein